MYSLLRKYFYPSYGIFALANTIFYPLKMLGNKKKYISLSWENEVVSNEVFFRNILFRTCDILKIRGQKRKVHLENFQETRKYQKSFFFFWENRVS